jgi:phenylpropionate dioxygenase-like ring-hydroxylating dioxygenase large terminal subunit
MTDSAFAPFVRNAWYLAAWSEELSDDFLARTIMNEPIVLFRGAGGKAAALEDRCCHRGAPLSCGKATAEGMQCGYHGMTFDGTGACVKIPGQDHIPEHARVRSYPVVERQHFVWIWMGDGAADEAKLLDYPYFEQSDQWPSRKGMMEIEANYIMMIDNLMDLTHLGFVHAKTIGGDPNTHVNADMTVTPTENGVKLERWMLDCTPPPTYVAAVGFEGNIDRWARFEYVAPASVLQWSGAMDVGKGAQANQDQPGLHIRLFHGATPKTDGSFYYFFATANGYRQDDPAACQQFFDENYVTFLEDKAIMEVQQARLMSDPTRKLVTIRSDAALVHARRALGRMLDAEAAGVPQAAE